MFLTILQRVHNTRKSEYYMKFYNRRISPKNEQRKPKKSKRSNALGKKNIGQCPGRKKNRPHVDRMPIKSFGISDLENILENGQR